MAAYRELLGRGFDAKSIVIAGDSAGGGLAVALAARLRDAGEPQPAGLAILNGWLDLTNSGSSVAVNAPSDFGLRRDLIEQGAELYRGAADPADPELSPVFADLNGLPPTYLQVGTHDLLLDDSDRFADRARAAGVDVGYARFDGMWHDFQIAAGLLREADEAMADLGRALGDIWEGRPLAERPVDRAQRLEQRRPSEGAAGRDHRRRLRRPRPRDHPEEGGSRRPDDLREGRRGGRGVAAQHVSGSDLRRALAALLVLVRAEPGLDTPVLAAGGDPRLPGALRSRVRPRAGTCGWAQRSSARTSTRTRASGGSGRPRATRSRRRSWCPPAASSACRRWGGFPERTASAGRSSTRPAGTTRSTLRASGSPWSGPARARSRWCPRSRRGSASSTSISARRPT